MTTPSGPGPHQCRGFKITLQTHHKQVGFLWTSDQRVADTATCKTHKYTRDEHPCTKRDSNPQSQKASAPRPTQWTARPKGSAII